MRNNQASLTFFVLAISLSTNLAAKASEVDDAQAILAETGVQGGLIVQLGCSDGRLTLALRAADCYVVQSLDADPDRVTEARRFIQSHGAYGPVSVDGWDGRHLPYVDNFVNLLVSQTPGQIDQAEIMRVLAPGGVAYVKVDGAWKRTVKPRPETIDEWTHFLHSPGNNAVAHDQAVGPPRRMQWLGSPRYSRHHDKMSSVSAVVSTGGRVFYIMDLAPHVSILMPPQWHLIARDAFNGTILWQRPMGPWHSHMHGLKSGPAHLPRKLVAVGNRVYVTTGIGKPITALDAASGKTVRTYDQTAATDEFIVSAGTLLAVIDKSINPQSQAGAKRRGQPQGPSVKKKLVAVDAASGKTRWALDLPILRGTLAADDQRTVCIAGDRAVCHDLTDGNELWQSKPLPLAESYPVRFTPTLVLYDDVVLFAGGEFAAQGNRSWAVGKDDTLTALSATSGEILWTAPHPLSGYASGEDLLVLKGVVWCGETTSGHAVGKFTGRDVKTGRVVGEFEPNVDTYWFHHRCYRGKATDNYLLMSRTGTEFIDVKNQNWDINHWVRGACLYGVMPANGLLYAPQHPCACFLQAKLSGFAALAPKKTENETFPESPAQRLEKGPAYDAPLSAVSPSLSEDWPTFRHDAARSGRATTRVPVDLETDWITELGGRLTSPVVSQGRVFLASIDAHTVFAVDANTGEKLWQFTAGGRIDSPPTCWRGRVVFGSADGYVYCLTADDGALVWRFRAAPVDRRLMAFEQIESAWPVHGSVLIHDNVLYFVAGRSAFLDGGMRLYRLDPKSGDVLSETAMNDRDETAGKMIQDYARQHNMPVSLPDVLSCDGRLVYMRSQPFELDGTRLPLEALPYAGNPEQYSVPPTQRMDHAHLFSPTGFLDDTWWHRTYWIYGSRFLGGWAGYSKAGKVAPGGKILVFDDDNVYGFGRKPQYYRWTTPIEHQLFAAAKTPAAVPPEGQAKPTRKGGRTSSVVHRWTLDLPLFARALVLADGTLFLAGPADLIDENTAAKRLSDPTVQAQIKRQEAVYRGGEGGHLWVVSAQTGEKLSEMQLDTIPVFDGMVAAGRKLYVTTVDGRLICLAKNDR